MGDHWGKLEETTWKKEIKKEPQNPKGKKQKGPGRGRGRGPVGGTGRQLFVRTGVGLTQARGPALPSACPQNP